MHSPAKDANGHPFPNTPMSRIAGRWPGSETDEQIEEALRDMNQLNHGNWNPPPTSPPPKPPPPPPAPPGNYKGSTVAKPVNLPPPLSPSRQEIAGGVLQAETVCVDQELIRRAIDTCETAIENTAECISHHDSTVGRTTRKNKALGDLYDTELACAQDCLNQLRRVLGWPPVEPKK